MFPNFSELLLRTFCVVTYTQKELCMEYGFHGACAPWSLHMCHDHSILKIPDMNCPSYACDIDKLSVMGVVNPIRHCLNGSVFMEIHTFKSICETYHPDMPEPDYCDPPCVSVFLINF